MKERPILFSGPMVRALLDGSKAQTRRVLKRPKTVPLDYVLNPKLLVQTFKTWWQKSDECKVGHSQVCPYGQPGDRLWVRETWARPTTLDPGPTFYRADYPACAAGFTNLPPTEEITWKPSIHMFRKDSRILLEITSVRVERLQDISEADAKAEGTTPEPYQCAPGYEAYSRAYRGGYRKLWESINGAGSWGANPWVWVVEFKRVTP